jgi:glutathione S-transferase
MPDLRLTGYGPSVYSRAVRIALHELGRAYEWTEADPFEPEGRAALAGLHPFARVPVLCHGDIVIYETRAILTYLDETFRPDRPRDPLMAARTAQVQGLVDAYGYWPLVRQVYSHGAFRPAHGEPHDPSEAAKGLEASGPVLDALNVIAGEGTVLNRCDIGQADWHLAPMLDAFRQVAVGAAALRQRPALSAWFEGMAARDSMRATEYRREETGA